MLLESNMGKNDVQCGDYKMDEEVRRRGGISSNWGCILVFKEYNKWFTMPCFYVPMHNLPSFVSS